MLKFIMKPRLGLLDFVIISVALGLAQTQNWIAVAAIIVVGAIASEYLNHKALTQE